MEKGDTSSITSESSLVSEESECESEESYQKHENDLTQLQEDIIYAIESLSKPFFIDLGGWNSIDLDFEVNKNGDFPLGIACERSSAQLVSLILGNPTVDPHRVNNDGANGFWLACYGGKEENLPILVDQGINYLIVTKDGRNGLHCAVQRNHK